MFFNPAGRSVKWPILLGVCISLTIVQAYEEWSYVEGSNGTSQWADKFPQCAGPAQSPIRLPGDAVVKKKSLLPVHMFTETNEAFSKFKFNITLEDHYLKIIIPPELFYFSLMNDNRKQYEVYEVIFHWGSDDARGAEHWLYGKQYQMETQVYGFNKLLYPTKERALAGPNGIAVLSFVHEVCTDVTKDETLIGVMSGLYETVLNYHNSTQHKYLDGFDMVRMLGIVDRARYFRYQGSLTTPPCTENVVWTIFKNTAPILPNQLEVFRTLRDMVNGEEYRMANNYRPTMKLNNEETYMPRKVYSTLNGAKQRSPAGVVITLFVGYVLKALYV